MFGIDQQIARLETLTCEMSRKLDTMISLLQKIVEQVEQPRDCNTTNTYTVKIDEDGWHVVGVGEVDLAGFDFPVTGQEGQE